MPHFEKHFTLEEANALLPQVRSLIEEIKKLRDQVVVEWGPAAPVLKLRKQNGGGPATRPFLQAMQELNQEVRHLHSLGVQLKDVDRGLVDFPAWRDEQEVLLCWSLGEESVAYWHEVDSGFAGRKPVE